MGSSLIDTVLIQVGIGTLSAQIGSDTLIARVSKVGYVLIKNCVIFNYNDQEIDIGGGQRKSYLLDLSSMAEK